MINISQNHTNSISYLTATTLKLAIAPDQILPAYNSHNKKTLRKEKIASAKPHCNCRVKEPCSLNGDCLKSSAVYGCKITSSDTVEDSPQYMALQKTHLKTINTIRLHKHRLYKHKNSFKYETKRIARNFQTTYGTKRKINKRYHLSGT